MKNNPYLRESKIEMNAMKKFYMDTPPQVQSDSNTNADDKIYILRILCESNQPINEGIESEENAQEHNNALEQSIEIDGITWFETIKNERMPE